MRQPLMMCALLVVVLLSPFATHAQAAEGDEVLVCCDASPVELYLLGSGSNQKLTPFISELGEEAQSVTVESSISSQESMGRWVLPNVWAGQVPSSTWVFSINYEVSNAAGVNINATATVNIGSKSFSAQTETGSSFLPQGTGTLTFDIDIDSLSTSGSSNIELELKAQAVVFQVPGADAKFEFFWGSEDDASSLEATIPLLDILMLEPEVEGSDVYLAVRLDSTWGLSTLALSESISLKVNGMAVGEILLKPQWMTRYGSPGLGRTPQAVKKPSMSKLSCHSSQANPRCVVRPRLTLRRLIPVEVQGPIIHPMNPYEPMVEAAASLLTSIWFSSKKAMTLSLSE
jgi:hypothetical protein